MKYYYHFVVNPEAGSGRGLKVANKIEAIVKKRRFPSVLLYRICRARTGTYYLFTGTSIVAMG